MARHLGVIDEILAREPTTDTCSLDQSQEDFYFSVHYSKLDLILWGKNHGVPAAEVSARLGYTPEQVERLQRHRSEAPLHRYLHAPRCCSSRSPRSTPSR